MREDLIKLLGAMGVAVSDGDPLLEHAVNAVTERIKNETNQDEVPDGLHYLAVETALGYFLGWKKDAGQLEGFDTDAAVKAIQEGDTRVEYAIGSGSSTPESRLDALIGYLRNGRVKEFIRYRRLLW